MSADDERGTIPLRTVTAHREAADTPCTFPCLAFCLLSPRPKGLYRRLFANASQDMPTLMPPNYAENRATIDLMTKHGQAWSSVSREQRLRQTLAHSPL